MIRPAETADLDRLYRLEARCFERPWTRQQIAASLAATQQEIEIGQEEGEIVAYTVVLVAGEEAELLRIASHPDHRRRGLARFLLLDHLERLRRRGVRRVYLEVRDDNHAARQLYESLGFRMIARRKGYYRDGADARIYERSASLDPKTTTPCPS